MNRRSRVLIATVVLTFLAHGPARGTWAAEGEAGVQLQAGASAVDVTPRKFPVSMLGSFGDRQATDAHDLLHVRALVLDDGTTRIALAVVDNCIIPREVMDRAKQRAAEGAGIPPGRMLIAATHTHTSPCVAELNDIPADPDYVELLVEKTAEAIRLNDYPDKVPVELQAIRIGSLAITAIPCEVFAEVGLEIKRRSPLQPAFTIALANGYNGYLPSPEQHALGGYETWRATSSYLEVDASTQIVQTLVELLDEVSR